MAPLHKICVWTQTRKIKRKSLMRNSDWFKNRFAFDFSDLRSNANFMQRGLYHTSSAEENDGKIIKFGWIVLILCPFLQIRSFSNFARFLRPMSEELCRDQPFIIMLLGIPLNRVSFCWHESMGFPKTQQWKAIPNIILRSSVTKIERNFKMTVFQKMVIESKLLNQI